MKMWRFKAVVWAGSILIVLIISLIAAEEVVQPIEEFYLSFPDNIIRSLEVNIFEKCDWGLARSVEDGSIELLPPDFSLVPLQPSVEEIAEFKKLPHTLTKVNKALGEGAVDGIPKADAWATGKGNAWQLAPDHPRNNKPKCLNLTRAAAISAIDLYTELRSNTSMYLLRSKQAFIHETGVIGLSCGYYQATEACETIFKFIGRKWWQNCKAQLAAADSTWSSMWPQDKDSAKSVLSSYYPISAADVAAKCNAVNASVVPLVYDKVFAITTMWDHNYHHFLIDCLPRLIRSLHFLIANPEVKIHIREYEQFTKSDRFIIGGRKMRRRLYDMLGLAPERFIAGPVLANEVIFARAIKCNYPIRSAYDIRLVAQFLMKKSGLTVNPSSHITTTATQEEGSGGGGATRVTSSKSTAARSGGDSLVVLGRAISANEKKNNVEWRDWDQDTMDSVTNAFSQIFSSLHIVGMSSNNASWTDCLPCQIRQFANTRVLVGTHGAGLTNMIFMPPGSLVVEITGIFDGRVLAQCGYHGSLAATFGLHHYIYYYDRKGGRMDPVAIAHEAYDFYMSLQHEY